MDVKIGLGWQTLDELPSNYNWSVRMWTDGSCWPVHGAGGWAAYVQLIHDDFLPVATIRAWGRQVNLCTTPIAEMNAIREGLWAVPRHIKVSKVEILSDSEWAIRILMGEYRKTKYFEEWLTIESLLADYPKRKYTHMRGHQKLDLTLPIEPELLFSIRRNHECDAIAGWARKNEDISDVAFRLQERQHGFK